MRSGEIAKFTSVKQWKHSITGKNVYVNLTSYPWFGGLQKFLLYISGHFIQFLVNEFFNWPSTLMRKCIGKHDTAVHIRTFHSIHSRFFCKLHPLQQRVWLGIHDFSLHIWKLHSIPIKTFLVNWSSNSLKECRLTALADLEISCN